MSFVFRRGYNEWKIPLEKIKRFSYRTRLFKIFDKDKNYQTYVTYWNPHNEDYSVSSWRYCKKDLLNEINDLYRCYPNYDKHLHKEINKYLNSSNGLILDINNDIGFDAFKEMTDLLENDLNKKITEYHLLSRIL